MITCVPYGGISNRLKCIISSIVEFGDINLNWVIPPSVLDGGVRCNFNDLFTNYFPDEDCRIVKDCEFIHKEMNTNNTGGKEMLNKELQKKYINVIESLIPVDYVSQKIKEEKSKLPSDITTVSVRTFKSFGREYNSWGKYFKIDELFKHLNSINNPILLTCDDTETTNLIKERYSDKIHTTPKRTNFGDFSSVEGMQDILIDLYLGGMSDNIYGSHMSSFSEMQWWFGSCKPKYINMVLHKK